MLLEDFRILISTPADEVGGGFLPSANYRGESGAPALQCPFSPSEDKGMKSGWNRVQGGQRVGLALRAARTCSLQPGGQREQLAQPTDVIAAQAGQLDHLDNIGPPPAS